MMALGERALWRNRLSGLDGPACGPRRAVLEGVINEFTRAA